MAYQWSKFCTFLLFSQSGIKPKWDVLWVFISFLNPRYYQWKYCLTRFQIMIAAELNFKHTMTLSIYPYDREPSCVKISRVVHYTINLFIWNKFDYLKLLYTMSDSSYPHQWINGCSMDKIAPHKIVFAGNFSLLFIYSGRNSSSVRLLTVYTQFFCTSIIGSFDKTTCNNKMYDKNRRTVI